MKKELSIFIDESGSDDLKCKYYLVALIFHDQGHCVDESIEKYERSLAAAGLPNIPFHAEPLVNGHDAYKALSLETRSRLLTSFRVFFRHLPIFYSLLAFKAAEFNSPNDLAVTMRRALVNLLFDNLELLQSYDVVKVYYDDGQASISWAVKRAIEYVLSKDAIAFRPAIASEYRLSQAADYVCALESVAIRFAEHRTSATDEKFFGGWTKFKKGPYKELRRKLLR